MNPRSAFESVVLLLPLLLFGCDTGTPPEQQYQEMIAHAREGRLTSAYKAWLPPSYERDLDDVLSKLGQLVDEDDYTELRGALSTGGNKLAGFLSFTGADDPAVKLIIAKLRDIPKVLGIDSYERFRKLSVASLLRALEEGIFREVMELKSVQEKIGSVTFELKERKRDWARLTVRFEPPDGEVVSDEMDLIRVEDRWVPDDWVTDWPATMREWRAQIEDALALKVETPEAFEKSLVAIGDAVKNPSSLLEFLPELKKRLGLAESGGK